MVLVVVGIVFLALLIYWLRVCLRDAREHRERQMSLDPWTGQRLKPQSPARAPEPAVRERS
jgi:hypothetical protein